MEKGRERDKEIETERERKMLGHERQKREINDNIADMKKNWRMK